jgi:hypothetical protein
VEVSQKLNVESCGKSLKGKEWFLQALLTVTCSECPVKILMLNSCILKVKICTSYYIIFPVCPCRSFDLKVSSAVSRDSFLTWSSYLDQNILQAIYPTINPVEIVGAIQEIPHASQLALGKVRPRSSVVQ